MSEPLLIRLYGAASSALAPALPFYLKRRISAGKEDGARLHERLGQPVHPRPQGPLVWLHGASVGELVSIVPLAAAFRVQGLNVLVTSGTITSAEVAAQRLPQGALHQFVPVDTPAATAGFMAHWRPDLAIFAESELWPNLVRAAKASGARLAIVNGRMSARSLKGWRRAPSLIGALLSRFDVVLTQSEQDAARFAQLGATTVRNVGNIKFDAPPLPADAEALAQLTAAIAGRPVFVAASTHPGEEEIIVATHINAASRLPDLLTVIAPRHPERGEAIAATAASAGLQSARRAKGEALTPTTQLYIADTMGELGLVYRLGGFAFVGGSFAPRGGQNPIEPAKLGVAVLHGPDVANFTDVYATFDAAGGALEIDEPDGLADAVVALLSQPAQLIAMQSRGRATAQEFSGAVVRTLDALAPLLPAVR